jgi:deoxyribodipyrimidine photo-lyase
MKETLVIYWARRDLRVTDNPALTAACKCSKELNAPLLPLFILENYMTSGNPSHQFGYPSRVFLSKALPLFAANFENFSILKGRAAQTLIGLSKKYELRVFVNEDIHPDFYKQINRIKTAGVDIKLYSDALTVSKQTVSGTGNLYSVFTPFKNSVWEEFISAPVLKKCSFDGITFFNQASVADAGLDQVSCTETDIARSFSGKQMFSVGGTTYDIKALMEPSVDFDAWYYSEQRAQNVFGAYLVESMSAYNDSRDSLELDATSKMSLALAWGLVSARYLNGEIQNFYKRALPEGAKHYISELIWREFYKYLYFHHPHLGQQEFQERYRGTLAWEAGDSAHIRFRAWIQGRTGYPLVDAAMHQIARTGWMHNRARMLVASVLTKNLGVDWRWGQEYFRAVLIDLDEASNNGGWQWAASVGADPKPIRIFNPYLQADTHDPHGTYQKRYLPQGYLDTPPAPIIEHKQARAEALARYGLNAEAPARDF